MTVFAGIAELERELIGNVTSAGCEAARRRRIHFGRPRKLNPEQRVAAAWRQKFEEGRVRLRKMIGAAASVGEAFEKLKVLVDQTAIEWASGAMAEAPGSSLSHRSLVMLNR